VANPGLDRDGVARGGLSVLLLTGLYPRPANRICGVAVARERAALERHGVRVELVHCAPDGRAEWVAPYLALQRRLRRQRFDLVHAHYGLRASLLGIAQPLPLVVTYHGTDLNGHPVQRWQDAPRDLLRSAAARVTAQVSRRADAIVVMSEEMRRRLPPSARARAVVQPMGVDLELFSPGPRGQARARLGWGDEPVVLVGDAWRNSIKRVDLAEAAVRRLGHARLVVVRDVPPERVVDLLRAADVLLVCSRREGSPNLVREALACDLPVVACPVGDLPELLARHPEAGRLADDHPEALASALREILAHRRPRLRHIVVEASADRRAASLISLYRQVLDG
jgi:glycosyltransferase involved in cell wall biosynthesis